MPFSHGIFITGTDTGIGKTVVAGLILRALRQHGKAALPVKPVQSGCPKKNGQLIASDLEQSLAIAGMNCSEAEKAILCPIRFASACSPHLAAEREGRPIEPELLLQLPDHPLFQNQHVVVEGAGGIEVPLCPDHSRLASMGDLMQDYGLPVILVARPGLGTLNHTLLSLQALATRDIQVLSVVLSPADDGDPDWLIEDNRRQITKRSGIPVSPPLPRFPNLPDVTGDSFDLSWFSIPPDL